MQWIKSFRQYILPSVRPLPASDRIPPGVTFLLLNILNRCNYSPQLEAKHSSSNRTTSAKLEASRGLNLRVQKQEERASKQKRRKEGKRKNSQRCRTFRECSGFRLRNFLFFFHFLSHTLLSFLSFLKSVVKLCYCELFDSKLFRNPLTPTSVRCPTLTTCV